MAARPDVHQRCPAAISARQWLRALWLALGCVLLVAPAIPAGVLELEWEAPTTNADGTPLTDLSRYRIYFGTSGSPCLGPVFQEFPSPTAAPQLGETVTFRLMGLLDGTTFFIQLTAIDLSDNESGCSDQVTGVTPPPGVPTPTGGGGGGGCFIATAAYGLPLAREVQVLRDFRDRYLLTHGPGRALVRAYYGLSPPLAELVREHEGLRAATRVALWPVIWGAHLALAAPALALMLAGGGLGVGALIPLLLLRARRARTAAHGRKSTR